jgi:hypothetical protein
MDHTMALIIHPMLVQLRRDNHGTPYTNDEDVPGKLRSTSAPPLTQKEKDNGGLDKNFNKRWDWIMDEMIWAFQQRIDDNGEDQFYSGKTDTYWQALDKDHKPIGKPVKWKDKKNPITDDGTLHVAWEMVKGPKDTFKVDRKGLDAYYARMRNGFLLFGKYYQNLWD